MLSPKNKRRLLQIIPFGIISVLFCLIYLFIEKGILGDYHTYPSTGNPYSPNLFLSVSLAFTLGILVGFLEIVLFKKGFDKSSFLKKIVLKTAAYMLLIMLFMVTVSSIGHAIQLEISIFSEEVWRYLFAFATDIAFLSIMFYVALAVGICLFYTEVANNIGQGFFMNFLTGKYHNPIEEERIFMFLDMKSSTTIAEQIGHVEYFKLLKFYYADLSDPIINHSGEIYQYVGDEVIVTWKYKKGRGNNDCINCFFAMKDALRSQREKYDTIFGLSPTFKAGIHLGRVTSGEIGEIKREITFSGDVLNTTARIQGLCNQYQVDILISEELSNTLVTGGEIEKRPLGQVELRGRNEKVKLFTIEKTDHLIR
jgi:adenylate cyclase